MGLGHRWWWDGTGRDDVGLEWGTGMVGSGYQGHKDRDAGMGV